MGPHVFSLSDGNGSTDNASFNLHEDGTLRTAKILDHEDKSQLEIRIRVTNKYDVGFEKSFVIEVLDMPEQAGDAESEAETSLPHLLAEALPLGVQAEKWYQSQWFGNFYQASSNWVFHSNLGWLYVADESDDPGAWLWMQDQGWLWLREDTYPWLFRNQGQTWIYFLKRHNDQPYFYNRATDRVE